MVLVGKSKLLCICLFSTWWIFRLLMLHTKAYSMGWPHPARVAFCGFGAPHPSSAWEPVSSGRAGSPCRRPHHLVGDSTVTSISAGMVASAPTLFFDSDFFVAIVAENSQNMLEISVKSILFYYVCSKNLFWPFQWGSSLLLQAGEAALRRVFFCFLCCVFWGSTVWHFFSSMRIYLADIPVCVLTMWRWI